MANIEIFGTLVRNDDNTNRDKIVQGNQVEGGYFVCSSKPTSGVWANGQLCYCTGDKKFYQYNGTAWEETKLGSSISAGTNIDITEDGEISLKDEIALTKVTISNKEVATKEDLLLYSTNDDNGNFTLAQSSENTYLSSERYFKVEHKADGSATHTDLDNIYIKSNSLIALDMEPGTIKVLATKNDALTGENIREWVDPTKELVVMSANTAINATNAERATSATNAATAEWATNATNATNADNAITAETADHAKELQDSWRLCKRYAPGDTDYSFDLPEGVYMFMWKFYSPSLTNNIFTDILALRIGDFGGLSDVQTEPRGTSHQILCGSFDVEERIFANLIASPNSSLRTFTIDVELFDKNGISHTDTTSFIEIYFKPISNINIFGIPTNLTCSTCTGTGKTSIDCTVCNGTNRCSVCDGTGLESCPECGGRHTCPSCGGDGTKTCLEVCGKCHGSAFSYLCNACGMDVSLYQTSTDEAGQMHRSVLGVKDTCPNGHSTAGAVETMCTACSAMGVTGEEITYSCPNCGPTPVTTGTSILPGTGECPYCDITGQITCRNCAGAKTCQGQCTQGKVYSTCTTCGGDGTI